MRVGTERSPITVQRGRRKIGELSQRPRVLGGKLFAGPIILVTRDHDLVLKNPGDGIEPNFHDNLLEVHYGDDCATYKLLEEWVVYSDGPPHPDHLQLGIRIACTEGVAEPED